MNTSLRNIGLLLGIIGTALHALATDSTISAANPSAYSANTGWLNFRPSTANGVVVTESTLSGYAYAANIGWINLGSGAPANGYSYANNSPTDFGVNVASDGRLTGYAYSANTGWINFEQIYGQPRLNFVTGQFTGYAWSANLGWLALATASSDLVTTTLAIIDSDNDGLADAWEYRYFGNLTTANATSNSDSDSATDLDEYRAGSSPIDGADYFRITSYLLTTPTASELSFTSSPARTYRVQISNNLTGAWSDSGLGTFAPTAGNSTTLSLNHAAAPRIFFRVVSQIPLQP